MNTREPNTSLAEWADHVPSTWTVDRLANVADIRFSSVDKHTFEEEVPVRLCNYVDVYKNARITAVIDFMKASAAPREIEMFQILPGDVLVTKDSETPDDIAISSLVVDELPGVLCGYHLALVRSRKHKIYAPYLAWLHASKTFRAQYEAKAVGVTRWGLAQSAFKEARVPLPPLPEQKQIASYLDTGCSAIDLAVAAKRRQLEIIDALLKAIITRAMTVGLRPNVPLRPSGQEWLGAIPEHWSAICLKRLLREPLTYGLNEAAELEDRALPRYLRITDFDDDGTLRDDTFRSLPWDVARKALLQPGDVLFARSGATVGKTFMFRDYTGEACFAGYLIRARTLQWKLDAQFLYLFTKTLAYEAWKDLIFTQATIQNISAAKYNYLLMPIPPLAEQHAIVAFVQERSREFRKLASHIERQISTLTGYRRALIHECVTGQRRVTAADLIGAQSHG
jgi:type I restriction enzyme, S subunit